MNRFEKIAAGAFGAMLRTGEGVASQAARLRKLNKGKMTPMRDQILSGKAQQMEDTVLKGAGSAKPITLKPKPTVKPAMISRAERVAKNDADVRRNAGISEPAPQTFGDLGNDAMGWIKNKFSALHQEHGGDYSKIIPAAIGMFTGAASHMTGGGTAMNLAKGFENHKGKIMLGAGGIAAAAVAKNSFENSNRSQYAQ